MTKPKKLIALIVVLIAIITIFFIIDKDEEKTLEINNFNDCVLAGNQVMESYPRQCRANGQNFTEDIGNELEKMDLIRIDIPRPNTAISSPATISGEARGFWFFEASFPVQLYDEDNNLLATGIAQAQDEWMTEDFVPFQLQMEFTKPQSSMGKLILKKDNPSGIPEYEDQLIVPVTFQ